MPADGEPLSVILVPSMITLTETNCRPHRSAEGLGTNVHQSPAQQAGGGDPGPALSATCGAFEIHYGVQLRRS